MRNADAEATMPEAPTSPFDQAIERAFSWAVHGVLILT